MSRKLAPYLLLAAALLALPACGKDKPADEPKPVEVLDAPANGSPVAVKFLEFTGEGERGMNVMLYNSGDKPAVAYHFLFRYYDAEGKLLKVKPGTPFEDETDFTSMSGKRFECKPKQNQTFEIEGSILAVPPEAVRAEVRAAKVRALAADGVSIEDWWSQASFSEWVE